MESNLRKGRECQSSVKPPPPPFPSTLNMIWFTSSHRVGIRSYESQCGWGGCNSLNPEWNSISDVFHMETWEFHVLGHEQWKWSVRRRVFACWENIISSQNQWVKWVCFKYQETNKLRSLLRTWTVIYKVFRGSGGVLSCLGLEATLWQKVVNWWKSTMWAFTRNERSNENVFKSWPRLKYNILSQTFDFYNIFLIVLVYSCQLKNKTIWEVYLNTALE